MNLLNQTPSERAPHPTELAPPDWRRAPPDALVDHIVHRFHERHREQLPELIGLAHKVEQVHGDRPACPHGLATQLSELLEELKGHMHKEEQILFPLLVAGQGARAAAPISVMRHEHDQHAQALQDLAALTQGFTPPQGACNTWRSLYAGLRALCDDLREHIHLENDILFESATALPAERI